MSGAVKNAFLKIVKGELPAYPDLLVIGIDHYLHIGVESDRTQAFKNFGFLFGFRQRHIQRFQVTALQQGAQCAQMPYMKMGKHQFVKTVFRTGGFQDALGVAEMYAAAVGKVHQSAFPVVKENQNIVVFPHGGDHLRLCKVRQEEGQNTEKKIKRQGTMEKKLFPAGQEEQKHRKAEKQQNRQEPFPIQSYIEILHIFSKGSKACGRLAER